MNFLNLNIVWTGGKNLASADTLSRKTLERKTIVEKP